MLISISHVTCLVVLSSVLLAVTQYIDGYHKDEMKIVKDEVAGVSVPKAENETPTLDRLRAKKDNILAAKVSRLTMQVYGIYVTLVLLAAFAFANPIFIHLKNPGFSATIYMILSFVLICLYIWIGYRAYRNGEDRKWIRKRKNEFFIEFKSTMQTWGEAQANPECNFEAKNI